MTLPASQITSQVHSPTTLEVKSNSPTASPPSSPRTASKHQHKRDPSISSNKDVIPDLPDRNDSSKTSSEQGSGGELSRSNSQEPVKERKSSDRVKKKTPWYSALYPTYKSRSDDFKRIFKDIPADERLVVDYSCALQRDILVHGRLYVSQNYLCFYANIFRWETQVTLRWKDVTSLTKEKTALVIPNAILVHTSSERYFLTSFAARDKAFLMLFRVWQNALMDQPMSTQEMWQWVHSCYGDELGLTSDDDYDYVCPAAGTGGGGGAGGQSLLEEEMEEEKSATSKGEKNSHDSYSEPLMEEGGGGVGLSPGGVASGGLTPNSTGEPLPTDPSDSSPSESESEKQGGLITCPCLHEGRLMVHMQVSIHVDQLFSHLFTDSKFFGDLHDSRKSTDVKHSPWVTNPSTNQKGRTVSLTVPLAQAIGPKHAQVTESQKMLPCSKPGEIYAIEIEACNAGVPYADAFYISTHYCLTRGADTGTSTIAAYAQIKYKKSVWGLVKNYIEKHCWSGLEEYYDSLVSALKAECERTRRAMASGVAGTKPRKTRHHQHRLRGLSKTAAAGPQPSPGHNQSHQNSPVEELPLIQPLSLPPHLPSPSHETDSLVWVVFAVLSLLLVFNAALYYKLWGLEQYEQTFQHPEGVFHILRNAPQSPEDWKILLQRQEELHTAEVERWVRILKASVYLLHQVEVSLSQLELSLSGMIRRGGGQTAAEESEGAREPPDTSQPPTPPHVSPQYPSGTAVPPSSGLPTEEDSQDNTPRSPPPPSASHKSEL